MYLMRFDMRAPGYSSEALADFYAAAIDMAVWGEENGCLSIIISQHHASPDNYLPSPMILASAIASRTKTLSINIGALVLNMYDPIKLAEDMAVLDIISRGRVNYTVALGYRPEEYAMFGVPFDRRGQVIEEKLDALNRALAGEQFEYQGRQVHVTPSPCSRNGITMAYGGHSKAAARRAGRYGMDFMADGGSADLEQVYREAAIEAGHEPGNVFIPPEKSTITSLHVARDVDAAWDEIGDCLLHDAQMYGKWTAQNKTAASTLATSVEELRSPDSLYRIVTPEQAVEIIRTRGLLPLQPLCGGCPPEFAWKSLKLIAEEVLPAVHGG